jgi:hypothetical protein
MPKYRYWYLDDKEDPEHDSTVDADDPREAAELAGDELLSDGDCDTGRSGKLELAIRPVDGGPAEMFEVYIDWSPGFFAQSRGVLPEHDDGEPDQT